MAGNRSSSRTIGARAHSLKHGQRSQGIEAQTDQEIGAIGTNYETSGVHFLNQAGERTGAIRYVIAYPGSDAEHTLRARLPPGRHRQPKECRETEGDHRTLHKRSQCLTSRISSRACTYCAQLHRIAAQCLPKSPSGTAINDLADSCAAWFIWIHLKTSCNW